MEILSYTDHTIEELLNTGIYMITHILKPELCYIGSAACINSRDPKIIGFLRRWKRHLSDLKNNKHYNNKLQRIVNKYGLKGIRFNIIRICKPNECLEMENYYINQYDSYNNGYNLTPDATHTIGRKHTQNEIDKIKISNKGKIRSQECKLANSLAKKGTIVSEKTKVLLLQNSPNKKTVYLYTKNGYLFNIFESTVQCDRVFNIKKGSTSDYIKRQTFIKKEFLPSYIPLSSEFILDLINKNKQVTNIHIKNMNNQRKLKRANENTEVSNQITKG